MAIPQQYGQSLSKHLCTGLLRRCDKFGISRSVPDPETVTCLDPATMHCKCTGMNVRHLIDALRPVLVFLTVIWVIALVTASIPLAQLRPRVTAGVDSGRVPFCFSR